MAWPAATVNSTHPVLDAKRAPNAAQVIAQAAKNLRNTAPESTKPKDVKAPTARKAEKRPAGDSGISQQYKQMSGSALW